MTRASLCLLLAITTTSCARPRNPYVGTWVLTYHGRNLLSIALAEDNGRLRGTMTRPHRFNYDQDGDFTRISRDKTTDRLSEVAFKGDALRFTAGSGDEADHFAMHLVDDTHAEAQLVDAPAPPWRLTRAARPKDAVLADEWPEPPATPELVALRAALKKMVEEDQAPRQLGPTFAPTQANAADTAHRAELLRIYDHYGWPKTSVFGKEAAHDYWLLVQHQRLDVQERLLPAMRQAAAQGEASKSSYAMLYDRVMANEGKLQRWGMQTRCESGKAVLAPVEDPEHLEERRRELHFPPVADYLKQLDAFCQATAHPGE